MMIKRVVLVNYCQHTHREIDITGNLVAIVGHNGVGKSNMLGALQFVLTGEQPDKNKADLLHWGAKEGHVVLEFDQDGKPGRIERSVSSNKVTLEYDGETTSGITNVAKEMETRLHMDKDLVKQAVFVRQTEVDKVISAKTDKREREVTFQKLIGVDAETIHKNLTDWLYNATKPVSYDIQLTEANQRLGDTEARSFAVAEEVKKAEAELAEFGDVDESQSANLAKAIASASRVVQAQEELEACRKTRGARAMALSGATADANKAGADPGHDLATLAGQEAVLQDELRKIRAHAAASLALKQAHAAYEATAATQHADVATVERDEAAADSAQTELASVRARKAQLEKAVSALDGTEANCPVCGKPLDSGTAERLRAELAELCTSESSLYGTLQDRRGKLAKDRADLAAWTQAIAVAQTRLESARSALSACEAPTLTEERATTVLAKVQQEAKEQREYEARVAGHKRAVADAELALRVAEDAERAAEERLKAFAAEAVKLCGEEASGTWKHALFVMESLVAETDKRRARHTELRMAVARVTATRDEIVKSLATLQETVESLKKAQAEQDELAKRLKVAENVKDWFHYANGPRALVTQVLGVLTDDVNRFLGNFTAPFIVIPDQEQMGFRVQFTDGRDCPEEPPGTSVLSGGERVQLAVAFRLAIYAMFAGKLGLLSLDEPTAYLDDSNVDRFGVLLTKVRELARNMNTQVFMATHERAVIPHMDSVIDLN